MDLIRLTFLATHNQKKIAAQEWIGHSSFVAATARRGIPWKSTLVTAGGQLHEVQMMMMTTMPHEEGRLWLSSG